MSHKVPNDSQLSWATKLPSVSTILRKEKAHSTRGSWVKVPWRFWMWSGSYQLFSSRNATSLHRTEAPSVKPEEAGVVGVGEEDTSGEPATAWYVHFPQPPTDGRSHLMRLPSSAQ